MSTLSTSKPEPGYNLLTASMAAPKKALTMAPRIDVIKGSRWPLVCASETGRQARLPLTIPAPFRVVCLKVAPSRGGSLFQPLRIPEDCSVSTGSYRPPRCKVPYTGVFPCPGEDHCSHVLYPISESSLTPSLVGALGMAKASCMRVLRVQPYQRSLSRAFRPRCARG